MTNNRFRSDTIIILVVIILRKPKRIIVLLLLIAHDHYIASVSNIDQVFIPKKKVYTVRILMRLSSHGQDVFIISEF